MQLLPLEIRPMGPQHRDQFIDMYHSIDKISDLPKEETASLEIRLGYYDDPQVNTWGAYHQDQLVGSLMGRFPPNVNMWFGYSLFTRLRPWVTQLNWHVQSMVLACELFEPLIQQGESQGRYIFYTNKDVRHQLAIEHSMDRLRELEQRSVITKHYRMLDYLHLCDRIYLPGEVVDASMPRQHRQFYPEGMIFNKRTIVVMHALNRTERQKLWGLA